MNNINIGTAAAPSGPGQYAAHVYHISFKVPPGDTANQITLPNLGSDLTNNCAASLHILAISGT